MAASTILDHGLPLFQDLTADHLANDMAGIALTPHLLTLNAWQTVFQQEDTDRDVYFLLSGALLAIHWTEDGREIIFTRFREGDHFGELAALDGAERSLAVVARAPSRVLVLPRNQFLVLVDRIPLVRERLFHALTGRIRALTRRNLEQLTQSVEQRLRSYLLSTAYERGQLHPGAILTNMPTHSEIAASIGANREIVSRTLSLLQRQGMIQTGRKQMILIDPSALATHED